MTQLCFVGPRGSPDQGRDEQIVPFPSSDLERVPCVAVAHTDAKEAQWDFSK